MNRLNQSLLMLSLMLLAGGAGAGVAASGAASQIDGVQLAQATSAMSQGEVRKVDKDAQKITIKHGPIDNLGMPPMTMVFRVKDPAMLEQVSRGDQVKFNADKINGAYTLTHIEKSN